MCVKKTLKARESEAAWFGKCLIHPRPRNVKVVYELRHGKVSADREINLSCGNVGCLCDQHHFLRLRKKTAKQYEQEAVQIGKCLVHPNKKGAARHVYQLRHGKLPTHIYVCHTCDTRRCILDEHHFPGTQQDNMQDMLRKGRHKNPKWTKKMRLQKAESSKAMWSDPTWHHEAQKNRIRDGYAKKVWTEEELAAKVDAAKRGHITRAKNKRKKAKEL